jgi:hypothetical protein
MILFEDCINGRQAFVLALEVYCRQLATLIEGERVSCNKRTSCDRHMPRMSLRLLTGHFTRASVVL